MLVCLSINSQTPGSKDVSAGRLASFNLQGTWTSIAVGVYYRFGIAI